MTIEIELTQGYKALVSDGRFSELKGLNFWAEKDARGRVYARGVIGGKKVYLHVYLMNPKSGEQVDHVDGNSLNCEDYNLRICSFSQNMQNRDVQRDNVSGYKGVTQYRNKYMFRICLNGKIHRRCSFSTPEAAARAYDAKARELFGEFARLNFPDEA